jgi:tripartite-type tricarboxylate transporter receptor subunit TctC
VLGPTRKPALPALPTAAEQGLDGIEAGGWIGLLGPAGLPAAVVRRLDAAVQAALDEPAIAAWMQANGSERMAPGPEAFARHLDAEFGRWGRLVAAAGLMPG